MVHLLALALTPLFIVTLGQKLPANFKVCDHFAPNLNECLKEAIPSALKQLKNGIPEIDASPVEPYYLGNITIAKSDYVIHFYETSLHNISDAEIESLDSKITRETIWIALTVSRRNVIATLDYTLNGRLFGFTINSGGKGVINFMKASIAITLEGIAVNNGEERFMLNKFDIKIRPESVTFDLENLIPGQKEVTRELNALLTEHWDVLFREVEPELERIAGEHFLTYSNNILQYVPV